MTGAGPRRVGLAVPGGRAALATAISGGYEYDRRIITGLAALGVETTLIDLPICFPIANDADFAEAATALRGFDGPLLVDGLGFCALSDALLVEIAPRMAALVHHPLHLEPGLTPAQAASLEARERAAITAAQLVIVTSAATVESVADLFDTPLDEIVVAPPGVDPAPRAVCAGDPPKMISVGAVIPRKGYLALVDGLAALRTARPQLDWRFDIVGPTSPDPAHAEAVLARIARHGLDERAQLRGTLAPEEMTALYATADVFVTTATLEGYGMAAAEATNHGLPLVAAAEAVLDWAPHAVRIPAPADAAAIVSVLGGLLGDPRSRKAAADASWSAAARLPRWPETARRVAAALARLDGET